MSAALTKIRTRRQPWLYLVAALAALLVTALFPIAVRAAPEPEEASVASARESFTMGTELARKAEWAEALAAYERSAQLRPHAVTTYDIGVCQRAMGDYTRAQMTLRQALAENDARGGNELAASLVTDAKALLGEIDALLATANVALDPPNSSVLVDGRPLQGIPGAATVPVLVAGVRAPGPGEAPPGGTFQVVLNPGAHVFTFARKGYADVVVNKTFASGSRQDLKFELDRLPATLHIASTPPGGVVAVAGIDVGIAPIDVSRPGATYEVIVRKRGYKDYKAEVTAQPGEGINLSAPLVEDHPALTQRWWFWTAAGVVVVGAALGTYFGTRPESPAPPLKAGGLGWTVPLH